MQFVHNQIDYWLEMAKYSTSTPNIPLHNQMLLHIREAFLPQIRPGSRWQLLADVQPHVLVGAGRLEGRHRLVSRTVVGGLLLPTAQHIAAEVPLEVI